jgi:hypothetical protein
VKKTSDAQGRVAWKVGSNDRTGLKGPVIEITSSDPRLNGDFILDLTQEGFRVFAPPKHNWLGKLTQCLNKKGQGATETRGYSAEPAAVGHPVRQPTDGYGQAPQGFTIQKPGYGPASTESDRFYGAAPARNPPPRQVSPHRIPTSGGQRKVPIPQVARSQAGYNQGGYGQPPRQQQSFGRDSEGEKSGGGCCIGGGKDSGRGNDQLQGQQQRQQHGFNNGSKREESGGGCCFGSGSSSGSGRGNSQFQSQQQQRQQQGYNNNTRKEKSNGGCCCFGSSRSSGNGGTGSTYDRSGRSKSDKKQYEKEKKKKEKKGKNGGSGGMFAEKSGFYDDKKKKSKGCCGLSCC